jgi:hypothetical protein
MAVEVNLTYGDGDPPSAVAIRKALTSFGVVQSVTSVKPGTLRVSFQDDAKVCFESPILINGKPVTLAPTTVLHSRGTIHRRELALWSLEELQEELGNNARVLRRLPTRDQPAETSGRILLGFTAPNPPADITIPLMGVKLTVNPYIPGTTRCNRCHSFGHNERTCSRPARCGRCGSKSHKREDCIAVPCCPACKGPHAIEDPRCPTWLAEKQRIRASVTGATAPPKAPATHAPTPLAPSQMNFPSLQGKRTRSSPPTTPAPKRWASPMPTDAPAGGNYDLARTLENQTRLLMQIIDLLQRLLPAIVPAAAPQAAPETTSPPRTAPPPPPSSAPAPDATTGTPARCSPKTRKQKEKHQISVNIEAAQRHNTVYNLGRDTASPSAPNIGTFDYKEK